MNRTLSNVLNRRDRVARGARFTNRQISVASFADQGCRRFELPAAEIAETVPSCHDCHLFRLNAESSRQSSRAIPFFGSQRIAAFGVLSAENLRSEWVCYFFAGGEKVESPHKHAPPSSTPHTNTKMQASLSASFTRTAPLRVRTAAKPRGRVAMRAVAYDKKSKGKPSLVGVIKVPKHFEHEMDALVVSHEAHMHDTHVVYNGQEAEEGRPRFLEYYVTKINEVEDPLDTKGTSPPRLPGRIATQKAGKMGLFRIFQSTSAGSAQKIVTASQWDRNWLRGSVSRFIFPELIHDFRFFSDGSRTRSTDPTPPRLKQTQCPLPPATSSTRGTRSTSPPRTSMST